MKPGLVELCQAKDWPLRTFSSEILRAVQVPNPSAGVTKAVGTPSVAEAAALQAAGVKTLLVSKQIYRVSTPQIGQAVTVAIAQVQRKIPEEF
ncbi:MAG: cobalamin biosynthesis protein [Planktothrix sp. GU0601_MAG3]|nr:MAG: cobalamin biosynthesis protein [Planktothrix sp. GU0601_MAG3]